MEKTTWIALFVAMFSFAFAPASAISYFHAGTSSQTAGASATYNITIRLDSTANQTNLTLIFPAGFSIASAAVSPIANFPSGSASVSGQNLTYSFNSTIVNASLNSTLIVGGIVNSNVSGAYSLGAFFYNGSGYDNLTESGSSDSFYIYPGQVRAVYAYFSISNSTTAGTQFTGNFSSYDRFGNQVNDTYNFTSTDTQASLPSNGSANGTNLNFSLKSAGTYSVRAISTSNSSATNSSQFLVSASSLYQVRAYFSRVIVTSNATFAANFMSFDAYGNELNDTYNFSSTDSNATLPSNGSANDTSLNFTLMNVGSETITAISNTNSSAQNATTIIVNPSAVAYVRLTVSNPSTVANGTLYANISSYDASGNPLADSYSFSSTDGQAVLPASGTQNGTMIAFRLTGSGTIVGSGSRTFTVTSLLNSSASNTSTILINATAIVSVYLTPQFSSMTIGTTKQFYAALLDIFGNQNTSVTANFNMTELTGGGQLSASGLFTGSSAGIVAIAANYTNIWNTTNVTINAATPTPTATPTSNANTGNTGLPDATAPPTPTPIRRATSTPIPTPTKKPVVKIADASPTPTPLPYRSEAEAQIAALESDINQAKGKGLDTTELDQLLTTAKNLAAKGSYSDALSTAKSARDKVAELIQGSSTVDESLQLVTKKGGMNWWLVAIIIVLISAGVYSYIYFAEKQHEKFKHKKEQVELVIEEPKRKRKGELDIFE